MKGVAITASYILAQPETSGRGDAPVSGILFGCHLLGFHLEPFADASPCVVVHAPALEVQAAGEALLDLPGFDVCPSCRSARPRERRLGHRGGSRGGQGILRDGGPSPAEQVPRG